MDQFNQLISVAIISKYWVTKYVLESSLPKALQWSCVQDSPPFRDRDRANCQWVRYRFTLRIL